MESVNTERRYVIRYFNGRQGSTGETFNRLKQVFGLSHIPARAQELNTNWRTFRRKLEISSSSAVVYAIWRIVANWLWIEFKFSVCSWNFDQNLLRIYTEMVPKNLIRQQDKRNDLCLDVLESTKYYHFYKKCGNEW